MKDEIKEILEQYLDSIISYPFQKKDKEYILDYITNLQQIEQDHQRINGELREENERLKEELRQEKKDFKETNDYCFELKDYKSRNEKAMEFMKENCDIITLSNGWIIRSELTTTGLGELFKILNEGDKDVKD